MTGQSRRSMTSLYCTPLPHRKHGGGHYIPSKRTYHSLSKHKAHMNIRDVFDVALASKYTSVKDTEVRTSVLADTTPKHHYDSNNI